MFAARAVRVTSRSAAKPRQRQDDGTETSRNDVDKLRMLLAIDCTVKDAMSTTQPAYPSST